jgi:hypothetical protein
VVSVGRYGIIATILTDGDDPDRSTVTHRRGAEADSYDSATV